MFPFFIECSKYYQNEPYKQKFLQKLAFGRGIHIIKRKDKYVLITPNGEFIIPMVYSDQERDILVNKLWEVNDFTRLGDSIQSMRQNWHTTRKKDKIYLLYKYVASLSYMAKPEKIITCHLLILALLLKIIKPSDLDYKNSCIIDMNKDLMEKETYTQMNFEYDYSVSQIKSNDILTTFTIDDE